MGYSNHSTSLVDTEEIGDQTEIGAFTHVLPGAKIGSACKIADHVFIENNVIIGDRVIIQCGVQLLGGIRIEDDVFIGSNVAFSNDLSQLGILNSAQRAQTIIQKGVHIGANATIMAGNFIGSNAKVCAGTVVTKNIPPNAIVEGNPARITGYVSTKSTHQKSSDTPPNQSSVVTGESQISGVRYLQLPIIPDIRGSLTFAEYGQYLDFLPKRFFLVYDVLSRELRGEHAHKQLHQFLVCVKGSMTVMVEDGIRREEYELNTPGASLHVPPMVWGVQYKFSADGVLLVLASDVYDPDDYIRNYDKFLELVNK